MADGKVTVEMKLALDAARAQLKQFSSEMRQSLAGGNGSAPGSAVDKTVQAQEKITSAVNKTTNAISKQLAEWRKLHSGGVQPGGVNWKEQQLAKDNNIDTAGNAGSRTMPGSGSGPWQNPIGAGASNATSGPNLNPPPPQPGPKTPWWQMPNGRNFGAGVSFGGVAIGAMVSPQIAAGLAAFRLAVTVLEHALRPIAQQFENARQLYAKTLMTNGQSTGFTAQRGAMARILGVGDMEVYRYGAAVSYLNDKVAFGSNIIAKHNAVLTESAWKTGILKNDWAALMSSMAASFADFRNMTVDWMDGLVKGITKKMEEAKRQIALDQFVVSHSLRMEGEKFFSTLTGKEMKQAGAIFEKQYAKLGQANIPAPSVSADRLPGSPWERMGLVIGNGTGQHHAAETARNTRKMVELLSRVAGAFSLPRGETTQLNPAYPQP